MLKKDKNTIILASALIILLVFSGLFFTKKDNAGKGYSISPPTEVNEINTETEVVKKIYTDEANEARLEINGVTLKGEIKEGENVYNFMSTLRKRGQIKFKEKNFIGIGQFIEEINGVRSDGNKYWIYYVNGKKAEIGVSNYKIKEGDVVSWKYEDEIN